MTIDNVPRGPLGDAHPEAADENIKTPGSLPPEKVEDRENVSMVRPEDYPREDRAAVDPGADNRGRRASKGSGPVSGSGAARAGKATPRIMTAIRKAAAATHRSGPIMARKAAPTLPSAAAARAAAGGTKKGRSRCGASGPFLSPVNRRSADFRRPNGSAGYSAHALPRRWLRRSPRRGAWRGDPRPSRSASPRHW
jgi:hypothetical protein